MSGEELQIPDDSWEGLQAEMSCWFVNNAEQPIPESETNAEKSQRLSRKYEQADKWAESMVNVIRNHVKE